MGFLFVLVNPVAKFIINNLLSDILKTNANIENIDISIFDTNAKISNLTIGGIDKFPDNIITAQNIVIDIQNVAKNNINIDRINLRGALINIEVKDNAINIYKWQELLKNNANNSVVNPKQESNSKNIIIDEFSMFYSQVIIKSKTINKLIKIDNIYIRNVGKNGDINTNNIFDKLLNIIIDNIKKNLNRENIYIDKTTIKEQLKQKTTYKKDIKNKLPKELQGMEIRF